MPTYENLSFSAASLAVVRAHVGANQPLLLMGPPGVGKTALAAALAEMFDLPLETIIASTCDPTDFGGFPVVRPDGAFDRVPMRQIQNASQRPSLLFLDEISTAAPEVQAALLRGCSGDRTFGDCVLHADTVIMAAANPPEQAPGGHELAAPLTGRFSIYDFCPTLPEVFEYFNDLGEDGSTLRAMALDLTATAEHMPELFQLRPPQAAVVDGALWAAPRDWEAGLRTCAVAKDDPAIDFDEDLAYTILAGRIGEQAATGFIAVRKLRVHLPTVADICADPESALMPENPDYQIGALGLLAQVAATEPGAAWIYALRLSDEIKAAAGRALLRRLPSGGSDRFTAPGRKARARIIGQVGADLA